jgi:hypothetical protein
MESLYYVSVRTIYVLDLSTSREYMMLLHSRHVCGTPIYDL